MTNVDVAPAVAPGAGSAPAPRRRVRVSWLAGAVGAAVVAAALVLWALGQVGDRTDVVMVVESVQAGDPIPASALSSTGVAVDSDATQLFVATQIEELVGRTAAVSLSPGDLLGPSLIRPTSAVPDGWLEVGAVLRAGDYPPTVQTGDTMLAVPVGASAQDVIDPETGGLSGPGEIEVLVVGFERSGDFDQLTVLAVPPGDASRVGVCQILCVSGRDGVHRMWSAIRSP